MGKIEVFGKWDLENGVWIKNPDPKFYGRSFAIANYDRIINNNEKIDYIIFAHGSRLEDHFKKITSIDEKKVGMKNVIEHYRKKNNNYDIKLFLMDADAPIIEDAKYLASYIEKLAMLDKTNTINVVGLSKCGVMNFYIPSFFKNPNTFLKTNIFNIAAPYDGTKLASPAIFYPEVKEFISRKLPNEYLSNLIYNKIINFYEGISSNSHMDYDIAINNGVYEYQKNVYDENFIKNVFSSSNIESIKKLNEFKNILTGIDKNTLKEAILDMNISGISLCMLNDIFFNGESDGMVYINSQKLVEDILDIKSHKLVSAHHDVASNKRIINDILSIIDDTLLDYEEKSKIKEKRLFYDR